MKRATLLTVWLLAAPVAADVAADPVAEVQDRLDGAAAVDPVTREAALRQVLLLREAEITLGNMLAAGPPGPDLAALVSPEAVAVHAALARAAADRLAALCDGHAPADCLLVEAEALRAGAPEVDPMDEWVGRIGPAVAGRKSAVLLASAGRYDEAERLAAGIARSKDRNRAFGQIAVLRMQNGDVLRAFAVLDAVDDADQLLTALQDLIPWRELHDDGLAPLTGPGERTAAVASVGRAVTLVDGLDKPEEKEQGLYKAAVLYLRLSELAAADALIDRDDSARESVLWLHQRAYRLITVGAFAEAEQLSEEIAKRDPGFAVTRQSLAVGLAGAGRPEDARRVLDRLVNPGERVLGLIWGADRLADSDPAAARGFLVEAERVAGAIADPDERVARLGWGGAVYVKIGDTAAALALAERLVGKKAGATPTAEMLITIALALGKAGQESAASSLFKAAEKQAGLIIEEPEKSQVLERLVGRRIALGHYAEAERVAVGIENASFRLGALEALGVALVGAGREDEAVRIAGIMHAVADKFAGRDRRLGEVAKALAEAGHAAKAEATADSIVNPIPRAEALGEVAIGLAGAGRLVEALRIAKRIEDAAWRAVAITAVGARL